MSTVWWPIMAAGCVIGVDLGGTKLLAGTVDSKLEEHHRAYRLARPDHTGALIDQLVETIQAAAELGHIIVDADGPPCPGRCPNHGCLEALVSGHAIGAEGLRLAREAPDSALGRALASGRDISGALVTELAHDGDPAACDVMT